MGSIGNLRENGNAKSSLPVNNLTREPLSDSEVEEFSNYSEYGGELANMLRDMETSVYKIEHNGGKAFADTNTLYPGELHIDMMASTGKGAGTEMLAKLAEKAKAENRS